ncbi:hypothetical protein [Actinoplanes derwentensis]|uniref:Uncharacterized protein n=1 Tax=Actinoplanes derwentensis TaxID=113562 RepID=A0A1H2DCJ3_9ACTN|nr:hypothetical protein [Actinoplanes derwentensis]SDT80465.1 hypothetical protein SAMN04489716_9215 [Actinoplanes derwentensis]
MSQEDPSEQVLARIKNDSAQAALRDWLDAHSATLVPESWTGEGYTEAQLLGAQLQVYGASPVVVIVKINPAGGGIREYKAHRRALADAPDFARAHLANLETGYIPVPGGGSVVVQSPAGGGLDETSQLAAALLTYRSPEDLCRSITTSLLVDWNPGAALTVEPSSLGAVLDTALGARLAETGTITAWAGGQSGLQRNPRPRLSAGPESLVNPFALIGEDSWGGDERLNLWHGRSHGDLHPGNLLVDRRRQSYCLVDLSRYRKDGLLGLDQVYLSLTAVAGAIAGLPQRGRQDLRDWFLDPVEDITVEGLPVYLQQLLVGVDQAVLAWARGQNNVTGWRRQRLICLTAVALILTGRSKLLPAGSRAWFFELAARAATRLTERMPGFPGPDDAPTAPWPSITAPATSGDTPPATVVSLDQRRRERQSAPDTQPDPTTAQAEYWTRLAAQLGAAVFDAPTGSAMTARTHGLRLLLAQAPIGTGGDLDRYLAELACALDDAIRPGISPPDRHAACTRADRLRAWVLDLLG